MNHGNCPARSPARLLRARAWSVVVAGSALAVGAAIVAAEQPGQQQARPQEAQRQQQIEQMAVRWEQFMKGDVEAELELVRKTCGSLPPAARRQIVEAANAAIPPAARQIVVAQIDGGHGKVLDPRQVVRDAIHKAVKPHATAEECAAYERECAARLARRDDATRASIVAKLDTVLYLSTAQRAAIVAELEKSWDAAWAVELTDRGIQFNGRPPAPDFASSCITPHLDERQRTAWKTWCEQAGWQRLGHGHSLHRHVFYRNGDGQSLEPDPWWTP